MPTILICYGRIPKEAWQTTTATKTIADRWSLFGAKMYVDLVVFVSIEIVISLWATNFYVDEWVKELVEIRAAIYLC